MCHPVNNIFTSFSNQDIVCLNSWKQEFILSILDRQVTCLFSERSCFNRLRRWKLYSYFWKSALQELCRTWGFWSTCGNTIILSNTSKHISSRNLTCIASMPCEKVQQLNVSQQQKADSSSKRSLLWTPDTVQHHWEDFCHTWQNRSESFIDSNTHNKGRHAFRWKSIRFNSLQDLSFFFQKNC